jgi:hypothetical protein
MSRPKGIIGKKKNKVLEAEIAKLELALSFSRQRAIRAGLKQDVLSNAKFTAECVKLISQIESLMFQIQPSALELARDYDNVT